jgi:hypothetical protein
MSYGGTPQNKPSLGEGLSSLHHTTRRMLNFKKENFGTLQHFEQKLNSCMNDPKDTTFKTQVLQSYSTLYTQYQTLTDEENLINRMERKSQIRNTLFRGISTLTIGFSIMLVYWVASECGISMPLMRIPL